jgi:hypothetical protein
LIGHILKLEHRIIIESLWKVWLSKIVFSIIANRSLKIVALQVGGGLSVGYGILETAVKEAAEEASIPAELIAKLRPAGCVS